MRESSLSEGIESSPIVDPADRYRRPDNCPVTVCSALILYEQELERHRRTETSLRESLFRKIGLLRQKDELILQKDILAKESEHRLLNGLQLIKSVLTMQSRSAQHAETSAELMMAAKRISTLSRLHQHLHALDSLETVEFNQYLKILCDDISDLLPDNGSDCGLCVNGVEMAIPRVIATPLAFIASELITNSIKYAKGKIAVNLQTRVNGDGILSVTDDGPGLPEDFDPSANKGLGMRIVSALTDQIHGQLSFARGDDGRGTRFSVVFNPQAL